VKPYLGAGIGVAQVKIDDGLLDDKGDALTLQGMAGASFAVSPTISLFAEGRYQYTGSIKIKTTSPSGEQNEKLNMTSPGAWSARASRSRPGPIDRQEGRVGQPARPFLVPPPSGRGSYPGPPSWPPGP
jgi:hypothetical protein